ncbi:MULTISPECIES: flagellar type III secretion system pore protein FliP [unclassified Curtobacterium]|uniref:flagellar type III secretion system pore protein FliP n=1 Tax=unclassified Curtobacterium TaxID=257496 RepID=UPI000DA8591C|nr:MULTISPECIES: flagellar type III secretion system pore protein FliP [unclassified Curtobacterium]PZE30125.1 flagellar biosynthetic protein FliP [Curtobacterium sp. MCBD17_028]PZE75870.1 flagellar biosynthetic protein FliP [Curtobacterium sp. MCBD17_019]PZF61273.1 flagellar biosynthetic protein FliP [Curtobacterium sp. MCBD17_034]PZF66564.1 flagellar biosynthetic protein FliP [Curtobacterium sp. MCBD17_013]PZM40524.1 flagellar biosynthetic protein FliP [Curtobacterium sp. MCBD17_031]
MTLVPGGRTPLRPLVLAPGVGREARSSRARAVRVARIAVLVFLGLAAVVGFLMLTAGGAHAAGVVGPTAPAAPTAPATPSTNGGLDVSVNGPDGTPSSAVVTLVGITLLSVAPALLLMMTSFTKIFVVLSMTRNALGLQSIPPNQVIAGLALFLSLFIMGPIIGHINDDALQPYLAGHIDFQHAVDVGSAPLRKFMLHQTRQEDLALMTRAAGRPNPKNEAAVGMTTLVPAFMISELRSAFIIGFVIFLPFLVIDLVVSAALQSMGMMMLPPVMISLPFKVLLFVLVDGWGLIIKSLIESYQVVS